MASLQFREQSLSSLCVAIVAMSAIILTVLLTGSLPAAAQDPLPPFQTCMQAGVATRETSYIVAYRSYNSAMGKAYESLRQGEEEAWTLGDKWYRKQALNRARWNFNRDVSIAKHNLTLDKAAVRHEYDIASYQCKKAPVAPPSLTRSSLSSFGSASSASSWKTNGACTCPSVFFPVCGADKRTYFNTCYAACSGVIVRQSGSCPAR